MNGHTVLLLGVKHTDGLGLVHQFALVAHFTTHLAIEGSLVKDYLVYHALLLLHLAILQDVARIFCKIISDKLSLAFGQHGPVAHFHLCGVAGAGFLLLHLHVEAIHIHRHAVLSANQFREVQGEAEGVEKRKCLVAGNYGLSGSAGLLHHAVEQTDTVLQGAQEAVLLFLHHLHDKFLLSLQFGIGRTHLLDEGGNQAVHEGLLLSQEGIAVTYCTTQDTTDHITSLGIAGQLAIGNTERNGTQVVHDNAHGHIGFFRVTIFDASLLGHHLNQRLEDVCIIVRVLALDGTHQTLKAHTGVNHVHGKILQRTVGLAVELHEDDVPDFNHLGIVLVHQLTTGHLRLLLGRTAVQVNLGTGSARTGITHFPEVVMLVAVDDMVGRNMLQPIRSRLVIAAQAFLLASLKHGYIQVLRIQLEHIYQIFPSHINGTFLEVVAKAPVAKHLKHGMVVGVMAHLFQVVVLAAYAQTLLRIGTATGFGVAGAQNDVLPLVHTGIGKHQCGVVLNHHGR